MNLTLTQYIDAKPGDVASRLDDAIDHGLNVAASRIAATREAIETEELSEGIRIRSGLSALDGCEVLVSGGDRLTVLDFVVPWSPEDSDGSKLRAANAFAHSVAIEVDAAA